MLIVPRETPGVKFVRNVGLLGEAQGEGSHGYIHYDKVRVPLDAMLGGPGEGFKVAQARLGGGRVHHAMRTVGRCQVMIDMMLERAVSRRAQGRLLADHQFVQGDIADSLLELEQFRLLVMKTAWVIDNQPHGAARTLISMCKIQMAAVYHNIARRAVHLHGSLGVTNELALAGLFVGAESLALADGPTEVHKVQLAKAYLKKAKPAPGLFPSEHIPTRLAAAKAKYGITE